MRGDISMTHPILTAIAITIAVTAGSALIAGNARAHEAPSGMTYSLACCHSTDCAPIEAASVKPVATGWLVIETGEVIAYGSHKLKDSTDGGFHRCTYGGEFNSAARTRCLYVPQMGF